METKICASMHCPEQGKPQPYSNFYFNYQNKPFNVCKACHKRRMALKQKHRRATYPGLGLRLSSK